MSGTASEGDVDNLVASGVVEKNNSDATWALHVRWCCRIDENGVRHQFDVSNIT